MTNLKKLTALFLAVLMLMSLAAVSVNAEDEDDPPHVAGWYVVGDPLFFGTSWGDEIPKAQAKMELTNGVYNVTYTDAPEGTFSFKVVETTSIGAVKAWHPDGMGNDSTFTVREAGSTVRFCLVPTGNVSKDKPYAEVFAPGSDIPEVTEPSTPAPPTEPIPEGKLKVNVSSNITTGKVSETYDLSNDDEFTVDFKLRSVKPIANIQGYVEFDDSVLELTALTLDSQFTDPVYNINLHNKGTFNHTNTTNAVDFLNEAIFLTAHFKIIKTGETNVALTIEEINALNQSYELYGIITNGAVVVADEVGGSIVTMIPSKPSEPTEPSSSEVSPTDPTDPTPKAPALNAKSKTLKAGQTFTVKVKNTTAKATFSSNKKTVATVSKKGVVTALKKGKATITVKVAGKKLTCKINVKTNPTAKIKKKAVSSKKYYTVKKKGTITVVLTGKAKAIGNTYKSTNSKIAKVTSKKSATSVIIKGLKKGKSTITVKVNKVKTFKIKVNVK